MTDRPTLYRLPEFIVLPAKLRKYALFTLVDGRSHNYACELLRLNPDRTRKDIRIERLLAAWQTPVADRKRKPLEERPVPATCTGIDHAEFYEVVRRMQRDLDGILTAEDENYSHIVFVAEDGKRLLPNSEVPPAPR